MEQQDLFSGFKFDEPKVKKSGEEELLNEFSIILKSNVVQDEYTKYIQNNFDLKISES